MAIAAGAIMARRRRERGARGAPLVALAHQPVLLLTTYLPFVLIGLILPSLGEEPG